MLTLTYPVDTPLHRLPAGAKLAALAGYTVALFALDSPALLALAAVPVAALHGVAGGVLLRPALWALRPLWPFVLLVGLWHLAIGDPHGGAAVILRLGAAVAAANLVTLTTRLDDLLAVAERLLQPLRRVGVNPRLVALAVALVIRFLPVTLDRMARLRLAWAARSAQRPGWRLLVPGALGALDDADRVAEALRARGGTG